MLLKTRKLDKDVVDFFVRKNQIYEDTQYHNVVFVGKDKYGIPLHAHKRSTNNQDKSFRINVEGSNPSYSFNHIGASDRLYVFEAPIDMLSFICLYKSNWQRHSYVSLMGTSQKAVDRILNDYPNIKNVALCLDNDNAGILASKRIAVNLKRNGYKTLEYYPELKDWNETLINVKTPKIEMKIGG